GRVGAVQRLATIGAEAETVGAAEDLGGDGEHHGVVGPAADVELVVADVGAAQLGVLGAALVDLARLDLEVERGGLETAHAGPLDVDRKSQFEGEAAGVAGGLEADLRLGGVGEVGLTAEVERGELDRQLDPSSLAGGEVEAGEVDDGLGGGRHTS